MPLTDIVQYIHCTPLYIRIEEIEYLKGLKQTILIYDKSPVVVSGARRDPVALGGDADARR